MKPIIWDINEMTDSTELYESRPNPFLTGTIYLIFVIVAVCLLWMYLAKIDIVVKSNGVLKGSNTVYEISSAVYGKVVESSNLNGQYVKEGDVLYIIENNTNSDTIACYQEELQVAKDRLEILLAYDKSLDGDIEELYACVDNPYYDEFVNRWELLSTNMVLSESDINGQVTLYQGNIDSICETIDKYNENVNKLNVVIQCVLTQKNTLDASDSYYYSIISSYLASYNYIALQYDNQINEFQRKIDTCDEQIKNAADSVENGNKPVDTGEVLDVEELIMQRDTLITEREVVEKEKTQALLNLELQQIADIEQQILGYSDTILSMEMNLTSATLQLEAVNGVSKENMNKALILTEKGNVATEVLNYQAKVREYDIYLKSYDIQNGNYVIRANGSGYYYVAQEMKIGTYVQEGTVFGMIYPELESKYYAEIYVNNSDIGKVKEGQKVKFEIAAYPSKEYGYFTGVVESVARNISIDESNGSTYYLVRVRCDHTMIKNKDGEEVFFINGMECQAKIVVDEQNILMYFLEKINLID